jgi:hypothetical protein
MEVDGKLIEAYLESIREVVNGLKFYRSKER